MKHPCPLCFWISPAENSRNNVVFLFFQVFILRNKKSGSILCNWRVKKLKKFWPIAKRFYLGIEKSALPVIVMASIDNSRGWNNTTSRDQRWIKHCVNWTGDAHQRMKLLTQQLIGGWISCTVFLHSIADPVHCRSG